MSTPDAVSANGNSQDTICADLNGPGRRSEISRRNLLKGAGAGTMAYWLSGCKTSPVRRPNVVLILGDYMGYSDTEPYGATDVRTPNLARVAREGARLTNCYATAPLCSPSRAGLLTGRYQARFGVEENAGPDPEDFPVKGLPASESTIAELLRKSGYKTALFGKWGLGQGSEFGPTAHGFDQSLAFHTPAIDYFSHRDMAGNPGLYENEQLIDIEGYSTDIFTDRAVNFIDHSAEKPFFLYVPYNAALAPGQPPNHPDDVRATGPGHVRRNAYPRSDYVGVVEALDGGIGRILDALDRRKLTRDTLLIFAYDHGGEEPARQTPLSGGFRQLLEGGIRVQCLMRWPDEIPAGTSYTKPAILMDIAATVAAACVVAAAPGHEFDGIDLLPVLQGKIADRDRILCWRYPVFLEDLPDKHPEITHEDPHLGRVSWVKAIRKGAWKFIDDPLLRLKRGPVMLYNLESDISEQQNAQASHPALIAELRQALAEWERRVAGSVG